MKVVVVVLAWATHPEKGIGRLKSLNDLVIAGLGEIYVLTADRAEVVGHADGHYVVETRTQLRIAILAHHGSRQNRQPSTSLSSRLGCGYGCHAGSDSIVHQNNDLTFK
jgi:hypothetical protein